MLLSSNVSLKGACKITGTWYHKKNVIPYTMYIQQVHGNKTMKSNRYR